MNLSDINCEDCTFYRERYCHWEPDHGGSTIKAFVVDPWDGCKRFILNTDKENQ